MDAGIWFVPEMVSRGLHSLQGLKPASIAAFGLPKYLTLICFGFLALQTDLQKMPVVTMP